jgi:SAM-dependent methyltransferase
VTTEGPASAPEGPAPSYAGRTKYDAPGRAERYAARSPRRHEEEWRLLERFFDGRPWPAEALDVPCGTGRLSAELLARGVRVRCGDLSPAMRQHAERTPEGREGFLGVEPIDLELPPAPDAPRYDLVLCFRLLHHLPDAARRRRVLAHLAARCRGEVIVSFHHPVSLHQLARGVRRVLTGCRGDRHATTLTTLRRDAAAAGLRWVEARGLAPGLRDLWVARLWPRS